ncbi:short-subunit dehydrogenase [Solirubrobacter pauli]|uniref:Short-subunit dehydrogenase n=1 Tax=Solirubrobacter pauli TaxID=166793 RepID=A0A660KV09_9ACTN|nr:SDR family oxidoreductase [Solirubrobacter pauli]RKQ84888.1 short-subunit dehydrogenase [Solirubrobacter pauli]
MSSRVLITGAGSGFGRGTALELARRGHSVIAGVQIAPQATELAAEAATAGVELDIQVLDTTDDRDRTNVFAREVDVLINNAGVMEAGPVAEIPMDRVRRNYEVNVFGTLAMCQGFAPQMVRRGSGRIINVTSMGGLITVPFAAIYTSTKHALESLTEGLKDELAGTGVDVCTVNPGLFGTGFNDRGAETMTRWFDPARTLSRPELLAGLGGALATQLDPQLVVDALVGIVEEDSPSFRNVLPEQIVPWIRAIQERAWTARGGDPLFIDPARS